MSLFLPTTKEDIKNRGWDRIDVILITGDAYIDHPSFGAPLVGRFLESLGLRVGIIANPDINSDKDFTALGRPDLFFGVTAGNLDSMIMKYTANKRFRSDDAYVPGGKAEFRPKRATIAYCNKIQSLFSNSQILIGGLEASLRRYAHYDYWDNKVRRSILLDSKADLLVYGMAERPLKEIVQALKEGKKLNELKGISGTAVSISREERKEFGMETQSIPSFEEVRTSKSKYAKASKLIHLNQNPWSAKTFIQKHGSRYIVINRPASPLTEKELDQIYDLPFNRTPHPSYKEDIPAFEMIRFSVTSMRGCFGGCSFCALTVHQGKKVQNRSVRSIIDEIKAITKMRGFTGYISDIGGPTANMYRLGCKKKSAETVCTKFSCVYPEICPQLNTDHSPQISMLKQIRNLDKVKKVFIGSGIRYDLANLSGEYIREITRHHISGQIKVAPEHCCKKVLKIMHKPDISEFEKFRESFLKESQKAGLEQYVVPYFISAHPGCGLNEQVELTQYLKQNKLRPRQVQEFIPAPLTLASDIYYSGINPMTGEKVYIPDKKEERREQRALMQYFKTENSKTLISVLKKIGREDLIGKLALKRSTHSFRGRRKQISKQRKFR